MGKTMFRLLSTILLIIISNYSIAQKSYYVSSSSGNDQNNGTSANTPIASISKLNTMSIVPGDTILFKRGDTFYGSLIVGNSGTSNSRILFDSYGSGSLPIISGLVTVSSWTNLGGGIWSSTLSTIPSNIFNIVTIDGQLQQIGRFPNANSTDKGYLTYESFSSTGPTITDNQLTQAINWTGADVVIRKQRWVLDRCRITSHSGGTLTYTNPVGTPNTYYGKAGYGYFIQNDIRTLDQIGEWYLNTSTRSLSVFFSSRQPSSYVVKASTVDTLVNCGGLNGRPARSYLTFQNLRFEGGNKYAFFAQNGTSIIVRNCEFNNNNDAIYLWNIAGATINNNLIYNTLDNGIKSQNTTTSNTITNNTIINCGMIPGMGESGDERYNAIQSYPFSGTMTIENNRVDSVGYIGIHYSRSNVSVRNNYVSNFCMVKDDGGGIYTYADKIHTNRIVQNNIVIGAIGAPEGGGSDGGSLNTSARGIYLDGGTKNNNILNNYIANAVGGGIYSNNPASNIIRGNTIYNTRVGIEFNKYNTPSDTTVLYNNIITNNIVFPRVSNFFYWNGQLNIPNSISIRNDITRIGLFDSNYYNNDVIYPFDYYHHLTANGVFVNQLPLSLTGWKSYTGMESNSVDISGLTKRYTVTSTIGTNMVVNQPGAGNFEGTLGVGSFFTSNAPNANPSLSKDISSKITGVGSLLINHSYIDSVKYTQINSPASTGSISTSKKYVLRFKTKSDGFTGVAKVYLRKRQSPYTTLTNTEFLYFDTSIKQHSVVMIPTISDTASYVIEFGQNVSNIWVDDIELFECNILDSGDALSTLRTEVNTTSSNRTVNFNGLKYKDALNNYYQNNITLSPYSGVVLIPSGTSDIPVISSFNPSSGMTGDIITIRGSNFTTTSSVRIGGTNASFTIISDSVLTVIVGLGSTGDITIVNPYGSTSSGTFNYISTCTFTYGNWSTCNNGVQTRPYVGSPSGCVGTPPADSITRSCTVPCTFTYGPWSSCVDGFQNRSYTSSPANWCTGTPPLDSLTRSCTVPCTFTYGTWSSCGSNGIQTRSYTTSPSGYCTGTPPIDSIQRKCVPSCSSFIYGNWSTCNNGIQTRPYVASPSGCIGTPPTDSITRSCTVPCTFTYGSWSTTCVNGLQTRTYTSSPSGFCTGLPPTDSIQRACQPCTFTYSAWTTCTNGVQSRTFTSSPSGCLGTPPADSLSRTCTSVVISSFSYDSRRTRIYIKCNVSGTMIIRNATTGATVQTSNYATNGVYISVSGLTSRVKYTATTYGRSLTFTR